MTVYVDDAFIPDGKGKTWCHLMADSPDELNRFAQRIGLKKAWLHGDHYDVTYEKKEQAIRNGAKRITAREMVAIRRRLRQEQREVKR